jgi:hypothetical protein
MLDLFGESCTERKYSFLRLDGSTPTNSRMGLVDRFNDPQGIDRNLSHLQKNVSFINSTVISRNFFIEFEGWWSWFKFDWSFTTHSL